MDKNQYKDYREEDFLLDEYFQQWVRTPNAELEHFWQTFVSDYPEKASEVSKARAAVLDVLKSIPQNRVTPERKNKIWKHIATATYDGQSQGKTRSLKPAAFRTARLVAGLAAVLVIGLVMWWLIPSSHLQTYQTAFGELTQLELSDGTVVNLNANSTLEFRKNWRKTRVREVWLRGEAFFQVSSQAETGAPFVVHTKDLDVEVTGTAFNVKAREKQTEVVLEEGGVSLNLNNHAAHQDLTMVPGQKARFDARSMSEAELANVETQKYSSWKDGVLIFDHILLSEAMQQLEEFYGKDILIKREDLKQTTINFTVPIRDKQVLFETLETIFSAKVTEERDLILIE